MKYQNSKKIAALLYFAIVFFPLLAVLCAYFIYDAYVNNDFERMALMVVGAGFFSYLSVVGFKFYRFIHLVYALSDEGIEITGKGTATFYPWSEKMRVKTSDNLQLLWLYDENKETIAIVDYMMPGYAEFSEYIETRVSSI